MGRMTPAEPPRRIHVFGASGSGVTTLGRALAVRLRLEARHLDTDAFYWLETDPPFTAKRAPEERVRLIEAEIHRAPSWVLSGSLCGWGDTLMPRFTRAVFLRLDPDVRMARLAAREAERYGDRIFPGGDLREHHLEFMAWARSYDVATAPTRSLDLHRRWMESLACPVCELDSDRSVADLVAAVLGSEPEPS